jgi:hypothetical protein
MGFELLNSTAVQVYGKTTLHIIRLSFVRMIGPFGSLFLVHNLGLCRTIWQLSRTLSITSIRPVIAALIS